MNDNRRTFAKNAGSLMLAQLITWAIAIGLTIFVPRYLGVVNVGKMHLAYSIWAIVGIVVTFGTDILMTKEIARTPTRTAELIGASIVVRLFLFVLCIGVVFIYVQLAGYPGDTVIVIGLIGISTFLGQMAGSYQAAIQGLERMEYSSLADVVSKGLAALLTILVLLMGFKVFAVALTNSLGPLISLGILYFAVRRFQTLKFRFQWSHVIWMYKAGLPYLLVSGFLVLYNQIDIIILSLMLNEESIGWYGVASRLFGTFMFIPSVFITAVFPALSRMYTNESNNLTKLLQKSFDLLLLLGLPIGLGVFVISHPIVVLLYGEEFNNSGPILAIMGLVIIFTYQNALIGRFLISIDKQNIWTVVMGGAIVLTIPLDLVLIPWCQAQFGNGAIGGGISFLVTEAGMLLAGLFLLPRGTLGGANLRFAVRAILAGLVMTAVAWSLREMFILIPILAGGITYIGMILILRIVPQEDWLLLQSLAQSVLARFRKSKIKNSS